MVAEVKFSLSSSVFMSVRLRGRLSDSLVALFELNLLADLVARAGEFVGVISLVDSRLHT